MLTELEKLLLEFPDKPWDYYWITKNKSVTPQFVKDHPEIPWKYYILSQNENVTVSFIKENPEIEWNFYYLSSTPKQKYFGTKNYQVFCS